MCSNKTESPKHVSLLEKAVFNTKGVSPQWAPSCLHHMTRCAVTRFTTIIIINNNNSVSVNYKYINKTNKSQLKANNNLLSTPFSAFIAALIRSTSLARS